MGLAGRERDCAKIERLLEDARNGDSGSLVVRGEAGIGKTTLLDDATDRAAGMTVLRCSGVEAESELVFAGLYGLVRPVLSHLGEIADAQSAALAGALGLAPATGADRTCARRLNCSTSSGRCRGKIAPLRSCAQRGRPPAPAAPRPSTSSPHKNSTSPGSPPTGSPTPRSPPGCSSAPGPSTTTCAKCSPS